MLLFAIFRDGKAYLLDVLPHGEWTNPGLVEIAARNWPNDRLFVRINGVLPPPQDLTQNERSQLRAAGVTTSVQVDGSVFIAPTGMLTTAGTATSSMTRAHQLLYSLDALETKLAVDPVCFRSQMESYGHDYPEHPKFQIIFVRTPSRWEFVIKEEVTGITIGI